MPRSRLPDLRLRVDLDVLRQELLVVGAEVQAYPHHRLVGPAGFELAFKEEHVGEELKVGGVEEDYSVKTSEGPEENLKKLYDNFDYGNLWYSGDM